MYSPFRNNDVYSTLKDVLVYKSRIKYLIRIWEKYSDYDFGNIDENYMLRLFNSQMDHIASCGSFLWFKVSEDDNTVGKLSNGSFCRQRICPLCQRRRSLKIYSNILQMLDEVKEKYSYIHLTLTIPNCYTNEMPSSITSLNNYSKALFNHEKIKPVFKGVIRSLEVTYNKNNSTMHPHLHCLVLVNKSYFTSRNYLKHEEIKSIWSDITCVRNPQISIRKCTDLESALREVVKYSAKPIDLSDEYTDIEALKYYMNVAYSLKNRRLLQTFGICSELSRKYNISLDDDEEVPTPSEYTKTLFFKYEHDDNDFVPDNHSYIFDREEIEGRKSLFYKQFEKIPEIKRELIRHRADWCIKHLKK